MSTDDQVSGESDALTGQQRVSLSRAIDVAASADYELGAASRLAELAGRPGWSAEFSTLMRKCVVLRTRMQQELNAKKREAKS